MKDAVPPMCLDGERHAEFKSMIGTGSADTVDSFDENKMERLIAEKNELQAKLGEITEERGRQQTVQDRLETIYTVLDGLKNRPMTYDDEVVRQLIDCWSWSQRIGSKLFSAADFKWNSNFGRKIWTFCRKWGRCP